MVLVYIHSNLFFFFFFFQAEDGIRDYKVLEFRRVLFRSLAGEEIPRKNTSIPDRAHSGAFRQCPPASRARCPQVRWEFPRENARAAKRATAVRFRKRSEERRVGKECRSRGAARDEKKDMG